MKPPPTSIVEREFASPELEDILISRLDEIRKLHAGPLAELADEITTECGDSVNAVARNLSFLLALGASQTLPHEKERWSSNQAHSTAIRGLDYYTAGILILDAMTEMLPSGETNPTDYKYASCSMAELALAELMIKSAPLVQGLPQVNEAQPLATTMKHLTLLHVHYRCGASSKPTAAILPFRNNVVFGVSREYFGAYRQTNRARILAGLDGTDTSVIGEVVGEYVRRDPDLAVGVRQDDW